MSQQKVLVDAVALREILEALVNGGHRIRELQATQATFLDTVRDRPNPINLLLSDFNGWVESGLPVYVELSPGDTGTREEATEKQKDLPLVKREDV